MHGLNLTVYLSVVPDHAPPFLATVYHLQMVTSSWIMLHVTKLKSRTDFMNMTVSSVNFIDPCCHQM